MSRFVFCTLSFLACVAVLDGCDVKAGSSDKSSKASDVRTTRWKREDDTSIIITTESQLGLLLRPYKRPARATATSKNSQAEEVFRRIDANSNGMIDAAEWVDFSKETSIWDFVKLLVYADVNDDESVSLEEFLTVQIVKINQSEEEKKIGGFTS